MTIKKGQTIELDIDNMAFGGRGVARSEGFVLFVRGAVPGDRVRARVVKKKKDFAEAILLDLIEPSEDRVPAPCPYSGHCGGCQWQHVRYECQLRYKKGFIEDAIGRIGSLSGILIRDVIPSKKELAYRNKMEFSFSDRRWVLPEEMDREESERDFALGLHVPGTFSKVLDIDACLLQPEQGNRILREVKEYVRASGAPVYGLKSHQGFWRFLMIRHALQADEWMVNIVTSREKRPVVIPLAERLCNRFENIKTIVNNITGRRAGIAFGEREVVLSGEGALTEEIGPYRFDISANSFFQTNTPGAEGLYGKVLELAGLKGDEVVVDLYSGTGTIPMFLSGHAAEIVGLEIIESAVRDAERNCSINGIENCRFILGDIRETLNRVRNRPDVLIIDPPRAGMHKDVLGRVMNLSAEKVIYVSCNPTTLARDLAVMSEGYDIVEIQPVDMFPQTYHVEAVAKLHRKG